MPEPGRQELRRVEVNKATKGGTKDRRFKAPIRVETQTASAARAVVKKGEETKRSSNAGLEGVTADTPSKKTGLSPSQQARLDARGTEYEEMATGSAAKKAMAELDEIRGERAKPRRATQAADFVDNPNMSDRAAGHLREAQSRFEAAPPGRSKEELRRQIGRSMQSGVIPHTAGITRLACQTPNCDKSVKLAADISEQPDGDVVCTDCYNKGDKAGAEYKDVPRNVGTTVSGAKRGRATA
ncbi:hypothetical protein UFOVP225_93 [uncultured Caudovirales phage]|uniref:Uncharacterized protein n=1 Tax=uncultured Caudovirales phage TaxID=2100421 RepID=A0A6J7WS05_9CAUD|nr:hypothetical protein UFOVP113_106 [uncultured Caudovirales phage]CAB5219598.1 hypothetical protein UFOVP225_93 [uncultured Caudovirales phage]